MGPEGNAGILKDEQVLFRQRGPLAGASGLWCSPAGVGHASRHPPNSPKCRKMKKHLWLRKAVGGPALLGLQSQASSRR